MDGELKKKSKKRWKIGWVPIIVKCKSPKFRIESAIKSRVQDVQWNSHHLIRLLTRVVTQKKRDFKFPFSYPAEEVAQVSGCRRHTNTFTSHS